MPGRCPWYLGRLRPCWRGCCDGSAKIHCRRGLRTGSPLRRPRWRSGSLGLIWPRWNREPLCPGFSGRDSGPRCCSYRSLYSDFSGRDSGPRCCSYRSRYSGFPGWGYRSLHRNYRPIRRNLSDLSGCFQCRSRPVRVSGPCGGGPSCRQRRAGSIFLSLGSSFDLCGQLLDSSLNFLSFC